MLLREAELVYALEHDLHEEVEAAVEAVSGEMPSLAATARAQLPLQRDSAFTRERLFAALAAAAMGGTPGDALPICTTSTLLWAGVDDIKNEARLTGTALIALRYVTSARIPARHRSRWTQDTIRSITSVAETSLMARGRQFTEISRQHALAHHIGTAGAFYARDAAMTARLFATGDVGGWRKFGLMYGLLRSLAAEHQSSTVDTDGNPDLAVPELLMAHAYACAKAAARVELAHLHRGARDDPGKRATLRDLLRSNRVVSAYERDLRGLHLRACGQLSALETVPEYHSVMRSSLDDVLALVMPSTREIVGL